MKRNEMKKKKAWDRFPMHNRPSLFQESLDLKICIKQNVISSLQIVYKKR